MCMTLNLFASQSIEAGATDAGNLDAALDAYRRALGKDPALSGFLQPRIDKLKNAAPGQSGDSEPGRPSSD